jgi:hypothetical protein
LPPGKNGLNTARRSRIVEGRDYDLVKFRNGYASDAPEMLVEFRGIRREGKGRSADYAIHLGTVRKISRWKG